MVPVLLFQNNSKNVRFRCHVSARTFRYGSNKRFVLQLSFHELCFEAVIFEGLFHNVHSVTLFQNVAFHNVSFLNVYFVGVLPNLRVTILVPALSFQDFRFKTFVLEPSHQNLCFKTCVSYFLFHSFRCITYIQNFRFINCCSELITGLFASGPELGEPQN